MGTELGGTVTRMGLNVKGNVVSILNKQRREVMVSYGGLHPPIWVCSTLGATYVLSSMQSGIPEWF